MTALTGHDMPTQLANNQALLASALDVANKVHSLLPDGLEIDALTIVPGQVLGQVAEPDDAIRISWIVGLSRMPGWRLEQGAPRHNAFTKRSYVRFSAVTEIDSVMVRIWTHITADVMPAVVENGAAA